MGFDRQENEQDSESGGRWLGTWAALGSRLKPRESLSDEGTEYSQSTDRH